MTVFQLTKRIALPLLSGAVSISGSFVAAQDGATLFHLAGATSGTNGVAATFTVTPNGPVVGGGTVNITASGATLSTSSLTFTAGATAAQSFTVTRASSGTTAVSITNTAGLSNTGTPINFTTAPATSFASVTVRSTTTQTAPFTFGHAFKKGEVSSGSGVAVGGATAQVSILNRWPDNSVKFAVIAGTVSLTGGVSSSISLTAGTSTSGTALTLTDLQATGITAEFTAGAFGSASWAGADWAAPFEALISGHLMSSWRYRKVVGGDNHLVAWMEVRLYSTGAVEVLPWIENGYCDVASPVSKNATYTFSLGGVEKFNQAIYLYARQRTPLVSGAIVSHWFGGTTYDILIKHDGAYLGATELVPSYSTEIDPSEGTVVGLPATFTPLQQGAYDSSLAAGGFHNHVCLLPNWDALHLTTPATTLTTYKAVVYQAFSAGRYAFHFRDEANNLVPVLSDSKWNSRTVPGLGSSPFATASESPAQAWSLDHQPQVAYLAYLITGWNYFAEEVQFVAATNFFMLSTGARNSGSGWFAAHASSNESPRTCAWGIRGLTLAATVTPDADPHGHRAAFIAKLKNNVDFYWGLYINTAHNPQGYIYPPSGSNVWGYWGNLNGPIQTGGTTSKIRLLNDTVKHNTLGVNSYIGCKILVFGPAEVVTITAKTQGSGYVEFDVTPALTSTFFGNTAQIVPQTMFSAGWMQWYSVAVWGWMKSLELEFDATTETRRELFWEWHAGQVVGVMGFTGSDEYLYRDCANYVIAMGPVNQTTLQGPNWITGAGPWFADWGEVYDANFIAGGGTNTGELTAPYALESRTQGAMRSTGFDLVNPLTQETQFANLMRAIAYVVKHDVPGAKAGFQRIESTSNYHKFVQGMEEAGYSQGALYPYAKPKWARGQAVLEWREIAGTSPALCPPTRQARTTAGVLEAFDPGARWAYGAYSIDTRTSTLWSIANGGHGDYYGNEAMKLELLSDNPAWVEWCPGSHGNVVDKVSAVKPSFYIADDFGRSLPASAHSYFGEQVIERHDRAIRVGGSISPSGTGYQDVISFDVTVAQGANGYDALSTYPGFNGGAGPAVGGAIAVTCAKDPTTECMYVVTSGTVMRKFTPNVGSVGGVWANLGTAPFGAFPGSEGSTAVDTTRNRLLWTKGNDDDQDNALTMDLTTGVWTTNFFPASAPKTALDAVSTGPGLVYVPRKDSYYLRTQPAGSLIYKIDADDFDVTNPTTTGGSGIPAGQHVAGQEAVYTRLVWAPQLRSLIYYSSTSSNAWALKLY